MIPAREVAAATTADVLGKAPETKPDERPRIRRRNPTRRKLATKPKRNRLTSPPNRLRNRLLPSQTVRHSPAPAPKPKPTAAQAQAHHRRVHADDRQLPVAADGFSPAPGHDRQADRVEGRIDGQRAAHAADARAIRHRSFARRHHQGPDHHALRIASRARREAGKNHRARQQHRRRAQGRAHQHPRARARQKLRRRRSAERHQDQGHHARPVRIRGMAQHQGPHSARAGQGRLWPSHHRRPRGNAALAHRRQHRLRQIRLHQLHHRLAALPLFARPTALRDDRSRRSSSCSNTTPCRTSSCRS